MMILEDYGLVCNHWALGMLILIGLASSELTGAGTIVALPISMLVVTLGAITEFISKPDLITRKRKCEDVVDFLVLWFGLLEQMVSAATCARITSATLDYMSRGRLRDWLFGLESHSLGEPWPDVLGVTIIAVTTGLFMLGLEKSLSLSILLYFGVGVSFVFFIITGGLNTYTKFWNWTEDFTLNSWECVLTSAAMCSFGFVNTFPKHNNKWCLRNIFLVLIPLLCYCLIVLVLTLMSHFRELAGTAIPLVRVFEIRDVDWARPVMAVFYIFVACLSLTESIPALYNYIVHLACREWKVLVSSLMYKNPVTDAPVLAIFTAGSLTSILAFSCPLSYLIRLLNVSSLLKCALRSSKTLYISYKPQFTHDDGAVYHTNVQYSKLSHVQKKITKPSPTKRIKAAFDIMPRFLRQSAYAPLSIDSNSRNADTTDSECLLLNDYNSKVINSLDSDSDSEIHELSAGSDADESSSSTDIDAIVQEYRERIQVSAINTFAETRTPSVASSRSVIFAILLIFLSAILLSLGVQLHLEYMFWISFLTVTVAFVTICLMPRNKPDVNNSDKIPSRIMVLCSIPSIVLSTLLASTLLPEVWIGVLFWIVAGLILLCRCDCCNCEGLYPVDKERMKLQGPKRDLLGGQPEYSEAILITR